MISPKPAKLEGHGVRLEPLSREHEKGLAAAAQNGRLWELFYTSVPEPDQTQAYISAGAEHQGPPGGGVVAALARKR